MTPGGIWEEEIAIMVENLYRVCKCKHSLLFHGFNNNSPNMFWCKSCNCKEFRQMSNMEWLVWQGKLIPWYKRLYKRLVNKLR